MTTRASRVGPDVVDRRQGVDDQGPRGLRPRGRRAGRQGHLLPGALLRPVLLPGAGRRSTTRTPSRSPARRPSASRRWPPSWAWSWCCRCTSRSSPASSTTPPRSSTPTARYLGKYRKHHIPHVNGFWEKFYFRPGNLGFPVFDTAVGKVGVYICYDRHFPEGWRALGPQRRADRLQPVSATSRGLSTYLWKLEQPAAAVANEYFIGAINRVGIEDLGDDDFYGTSYFVDPRGQVRRRASADAHKPELRRPRPRPGPAHRGAQPLGVLPRPPAGRLRRPGERPDDRS